MADNPSQDHTNQQLAFYREASPPRPRPSPLSLSWVAGSIPSTYKRAQPPHPSWDLPILTATQMSPLLQNPPATSTAMRPWGLTPAPLPVLLWDCPYPCCQGAPHCHAHWPVFSPAASFFRLPLTCSSHRLWDCLLPSPLPASLSPMLLSFPTPSSTS